MFRWFRRVRVARFIIDGGSGELTCLIVTDAGSFRTAVQDSLFVVEVGYFLSGVFYRFAKLGWA